MSDFIYEHARCVDCHEQHDIRDLLQIDGGYRCPTCYEAYLETRDEVTMEKLHYISNGGI